jgi:hypothetical protein
VDIQIRDNLHQPVTAAEVDIDWSDGSTTSCMTNSNGRCRIVGFQWIWMGSIFLSGFEFK